VGKLGEEGRGDAHFAAVAPLRRRISAKVMLLRSWVRDQSTSMGDGGTGGLMRRVVVVVVATAVLVVVMVRAEFRFVLWTL
jgi:hypothetical protein